MERQVVLLLIPEALGKLPRLVIGLEIVPKRFLQCLSDVPAELALQTFFRLFLCMYK